MEKFNRQKIIKTLLFVIELLVLKKFDNLYEKDFEKSLTIDEIKGALVNITLPLNTLPIDEFKNMDIFKTTDKNKILVQINLWYGNQQSDYTLSCLIKNTKSNNSIYDFSIDSIRVL